jgi:hypothetical protein
VRGFGTLGFSLRAFHIVKKVLMGQKLRSQPGPLSLNKGARNDSL